MSREIGTASVNLTFKYGRHPAINIIADTARQHFGEILDGNPNPWLPLSVRYGFAESLLAFLAASGFEVAHTTVHTEPPTGHNRQPAINVIADTAQRHFGQVSQGYRFADSLLEALTAAGFKVIHDAAPACSICGQPAQNLIVDTEAIEIPTRPFTTQHPGAEVVTFQPCGHTHRR